MRDLYVDSSVVLRALLDRSLSADAWIEAQRSDSRRFVGSRLVELEVRRVAANARKLTKDVDSYLNRFTFYLVDNALFDEALAITEPLGSADSLHIATALRLGTDVVELVTHDAQMAAAAKALGFVVHDPVTDDPGRGPVA